MIKLIFTKSIREELDDSVIVFFDDILAYSKTKEDHEQHLCHVLEILTKAKMYAKHSKCSFLIEKVFYLGFIVSKDGLSPYSTNMKAIVSWPILRNVSQV